MFQKYYNIWMKAFLALGTGGLENQCWVVLYFYEKKTDFCSLKQIGIVAVPDPVLVAQIEQEIWVQFFFFFSKNLHSHSENQSHVKNLVLTNRDLNW